MTSTAATRPPEYTTSTPVLHLAFELGQATWKLGFTPGLGQRPRERTIAARDVTALLAEIERAKERFGLSADVGVVSCYEAGPAGGARPDGGGGRSTTAPPGVADGQAGSGPGDEPDEGAAREPGGGGRGGRRAAGGARGSAAVGWDPLAGGLAGAAGAGVGESGVAHGADPATGGGAGGAAAEWDGAGGGAGATPAPAPGDWDEQRVAVCDGVFRVAAVSQPARGRRAGGVDADALSEWRAEPGTRDRQGRQPLHPGDGDRDRLGVAAVSAGERVEPVVPGAVWPGQQPHPADRDRGQI